MEKETFITDTNRGECLSHYYGEWHVSGELEAFLDKHEGKEVKITIEVLDDDDREKHCFHGLHAGSLDYPRGFIHTDKNGVNSLM